MTPEGSDESEGGHIANINAVLDDIAVAHVMEDILSEQGQYVRTGMGSFEGAYHTPSPPEGRLDTAIRLLSQVYDHPPDQHGIWHGRRLIRERHEQDEEAYRIARTLRTPRLSDDIPSPLLDRDWETKDV